MILSVNPEFGVELALAVPYAYWLHKNNLLEAVETSKGMKPFYYFCKNVKEKFSERSLDNIRALPGVPNVWIHHNSIAITGKDYSFLTDEEKESVNGVLDYSQWECPPYKEFYKNSEYKISNKMAFVTNKFNIEHGEPPMGYFDIECLIKIFSILKDKGYIVIYKRAKNTEPDFALDSNESNSLSCGYKDIVAELNGVVITDYELTKYFSNVILLDDLIDDGKSYNETQLKILANCQSYVSVCGGNSILSCLFGGNVISYVHKGKELRPNYFGKNSYFRKLAGANIFPVKDEQVMTSGKHDYTELYNQIEKQL